MKKLLHPKIKELQLKSTPIALSGSYVDAKGQLQEIDFKIDVSEQDRTVKGYLSVWGVKDRHGEIMVKGCFAKSIAERGPDSVSKQKIAFLWMHDLRNPIGRFTKLKEDNYGLYFEAELDKCEIGDRALEQMRSGTLNQFSTGVVDMFDRMQYDSKQDAILVYETILMEGSPVVLGSNEETFVLKTAQELIDHKVLLDERTEDFIHSISRDRQLELRQLISEHITFTKSQPLERKQKTLDLSFPEKVPFKVAGYELDLNTLAV